MSKRKGVFIGAYVPNQLKVALMEWAKADNFMTLSDKIKQILTTAVLDKKRNEQPCTTGETK
jgi:hypothetical protein